MRADCTDVRGLETLVRYEKCVQKEALVFTNWGNLTRIIARVITL
jgi:hypothetical protein